MYKRIAALVVPVLCFGMTVDAAAHSANHSEPHSSYSIGEVEFSRCTVTSQGRERKVDCATVPVPEDPKNPHSKTIDLFVVRLPAKRQSNTNQDAMLFLAGGPGQAASEAFLFSDLTYSKINSTRDIYLIDQRGTGRSNPLTCPNTFEHHQRAFDHSDDEKYIQIVQECLTEIDRDTRQYTTENSIKDFEHVRQSLGISQWNLLGVSYGTRVAMHYMAYFPDQVRTAVLDSVVHPTEPLGPSISLNSQRALDTIIARCASEPACQNSVPNFASDIQILLDQFQEKPVEFKFEDFNTGKIRNISLSHQDVTSLVRMFLYQPYSSALLPPIIHEAAENQFYAPIARLTEQWAEKFQQSLSIGLHNSIMCTEDIPFVTQVDSTGYLGDSIITTMRNTCKVWPQGDSPKPTLLQTQLQTPTLLFSGEYDPITPPEYADFAAKIFTNSKHFILNGQAHSVSGTGCAPYLINQFVASASVDGLNPACLSRISPSPLFINFNGTAP